MTFQLSSCLCTAQEPLASSLGLGRDLLLFSFVRICTLQGRGYIIYMLERQTLDLKVECSISGGLVLFSKRVIQFDLGSFSTPINHVELGDLLTLSWAIFPTRKIKAFFKGVVFGTFRVSYNKRLNQFAVKKHSKVPKWPQSEVDSNSRPTAILKFSFRLRRNAIKKKNLC